MPKDVHTFCVTEEAVEEIKLIYRKTDDINEFPEQEDKKKEQETRETRY